MGGFGVESGYGDYRVWCGVLVGKLALRSLSCWPASGAAILNLQMLKTTFSLTRK